MDAGGTPTPPETPWVTRVLRALADESAHSGSNVVRPGAIETRVDLTAVEIAGALKAAERRGLVEQRNHGWCLTEPGWDHVMAGTRLAADPLGVVCPDCPHPQSDHDLPGLDLHGCSHHDCWCGREADAPVRAMNALAAALRRRSGGRESCIDIYDQEAAARHIADLAASGFTITEETR